MFAGRCKLAVFLKTKQCATHWHCLQCIVGYKPRKQALAHVTLKICFYDDKIC